MRLGHNIVATEARKGKVYPSFLPASVAVLFVVAATSCSREDVAEIPLSDNLQLNEYIESAKNHSVVSIGESVPDTVFVGERHHLDLNFTDKDEVLGRVQGLTVVNDTLYIADNQKNSITAVSLNGNGSRKHGDRGSGPGEFQFLTGIDHNNEYIFVSDKSGIQLFNHQFEVQDSKIMPPYNDVWTVSDSKLFLLKNPYSEETLLQIRDASPPFNEMETVIKPIIPPGMQPGPYNSLEMSASPDGTLAYSFFGLPYLFIMDTDRNADHVIAFNFAGEKELENPSVEPVNSEQSVRVSAFISTLFFTEEKTIYFTWAMDLYKLAWNGTGYEMDRVIHFAFEDPEKRKSNPWGLQATSLTVSGDHMYIGSIFEEDIYVIDLEQI